MKQVLLILIGCLAAASLHANPTAHAALCGVNAQWKHYPADWASAPSSPLATDAEWIQHHLRIVEEKLRNHLPAGLSSTQKKARVESLDILRGYWQAGRFPQNEAKPVRTPVFIDAHSTFCAVGFLLENGGAGDLARSVAAENNFVYLPDLVSPALDAWAHDHGFTREELAWIQPAYPPMYFAASVGGGTNGWVNELLVSSDGQKLYVGGSFTHVNGSLSAPNVSYVTESAGTYTWHNIGMGLEGRVNALVEWDGKLVAGGNSIISQGPVGGSIALWNGTTWAIAGQTSGEIHDLAVFRDTLYAAGSFNTASGPANFARWNGTQWIPISGLTGRVNTMEAVGSHLFLGGRFLYNGDTANAIRWNAESSYQPFASRMWNEVRDFEVFKDTVYASCRFTSGIVHAPNDIAYLGKGSTDTNLVCKLVGNAWENFKIRPLSAMYSYDTTVSRYVAINTLCVWNDTLLSGGDLGYYPMVGNVVSGMLPITGPPYPSARWFNVDSAINKLVAFKGTIFAAGHIKQAYNIQLNGICRQAYSHQPSSVKEALDAPSRTALAIYPNPAKAKTEVSVSAPFSARSIRMLDITGKEVWTSYPKNQTQASVPLPQTAGQYILEWIGEGGKRASGVVVVE